MQDALKERIGSPDLFCGRETEMKWLSKSKRLDLLSHSQFKNR